MYCTTQQLHLFKIFFWTVNGSIIATSSLSADEFTADEYKFYFETRFLSCTQPDSVHRDEEEQAQQVVVTPVTADQTAATKQHSAD